MLIDLSSMSEIQGWALMKIPCMLTLARFYMASPATIGNLFTCLSKLRRQTRQQHNEHSTSILDAPRKSTECFPPSDAAPRCMVAPGMVIFDHNKAFKEADDCHTRASGRGWSADPCCPLPFASNTLASSCDRKDTEVLGALQPKKNVRREREQERRTVSM